MNLTDLITALVLIRNNKLDDILHSSSKDAYDS